ncbi:MAG: DinB family protein [Acidobacteriota bacterium]
MNFSLPHTIEILERTPAVLDAWLGGLSEPWLDCDEGDRTFSPRDVLGHLLDGEELDWIPRTHHILQLGTSRPLAAFDRFAFRERYAGEGSQQLLATLARLRARNLATLKSLDLGEEELSMQGRHPDLGLVTLRQHLACWAVHDLAHLRQVARVMAKRYRFDVGPWTSYFRVFEE